MSSFDGDKGTMLPNYKVPFQGAELGTVSVHWGLLRKENSISIL